MKSILRTAAAALAVAAVTAPAIAADVPAYLPAFVPPPLFPIWDWNGFYVGANLGGAWQDRSATISDQGTGTILGSGSGDQSSFAGGAQFGVNFALWRSWMVGMEADVSGALLHGTSVASNAAGTTQAQYDSKTDVFGTARGRAGYIWNNFLFYGTGGFGWSDAIVTRTQVTGMTGGATPGTIDKLSAAMTGWVVGGGFEWAFAPKWTVRVEYLHLDLGPHPFMFTASGLRSDTESTIDVFRVGLNYRFNLLSLAP